MGRVETYSMPTRDGTGGQIVCPYASEAGETAADSACPTIVHRKWIAPMMHEILGVADEANVHRRWFHDDYFDLFVWQTDGGEMVQFQLCYGIDPSEQALVWHKHDGFFLDGTKSASSGKGEPLTARFVVAANALPEEIRTAMTARVREFAEQKVIAMSRRKRFRRASWQRA
jgi:hypothetical protein